MTTKESPLRRALLLFLGALLISSSSVHAIYPDGHFDYVTKLESADQLSSLVSENIEAGRTLFAFTDAGNTDVAFADINLREAPIRGEPFNPGRGGWPTIRFFNKETGPDGAPYEKKTEMAMCQELGDVGRMTAYVEEAGKTSLGAASIAEEESAEAVKEEL